MSKAIYGESLVAAMIAGGYVSLCTADPGEACNQTTNEVTYTGYSRPAVSLSTTPASMMVTQTHTINSALIEFGKCTSGTETATHFIIGSSATGAGKAWYYGPLSVTVPIAVDRTPLIPAGISGNYPQPGIYIAED